MTPVVNYIALRADESRSGYISAKPNVETVFPFREDGIMYDDVNSHLGRVGIGLAKVHGLGENAIWLLLLLLSAENRMGASQTDVPRPF